MADRRPLAFTPDNFDFPPATSSASQDIASDANTSVPVRLDRLRRALQRTRDQYHQFEAALTAGDPAAADNHTRWVPPPRLRRRRARDSPPHFSRRASTTDPSSDADDTRPRQAKRRKLHQYDQEPRSTFKYGYYGQVEPGKLRLELESCDGDTFRDELSDISLGPENILKHDKSVYCSRASKCNIVLRHHDFSPFCLEKLHIIAPENGFTAPVREGLVYVAMSRRELLPYMDEADQQSPLLNPPRSPPAYTRRAAQLTLQESLRDPEIARALAQTRGTRDVSPFDFGTMDQDGASPPNEDQENPWNTTGDVDATWPALEPSNRPSSLQQAQAFACDDQISPSLPDDDTHVVLLTDDEIAWPEEPTHSDVLQDRQRRQRRMQNIDEDMYGWDARYRSMPARQIGRGRRVGWQYPPSERSGEIPPFAPTKSSSVARARFNIKDGRHKIAIKFDPPISGTHILLKLQTPYTGKNIDLQAVIASGYAGQRFFPAVQYA
ncbi:hypothetical protein MBLNU459_g5356t1 [Dothideomycetes sp. NU459]